MIINNKLTVSRKILMLLKYHLTQQNNNKIEIIKVDFFLKNKKRQVFETQREWRERVEFN